MSPPGSVHRALDGKGSLLRNHQVHFEWGHGLDRVGDAGRHDDSLPGVQRVWDTVNGDLSGALQDGGPWRPPGGGVGY